MGYENQLGQKDMTNSIQQGFSYTNTGLERGFANIGNLIQNAVCSIQTSGSNNTQRLIDVMNNHWTEDLRQKYNDARLELSQRDQTTAIVSALKTTTTTTTA